jgi:hypothetical protein
MLGCGALVVNLLSPSGAQAQAQFDYNYVLADSDLFDSGSMSLEQLQAFLELKGGSLARYIEPATRLSAANIIYSVARDFQLNPKFLLALLQKEQSLVEDPAPSQSSYDWATGYAVCDDCDVSSPLLQRYKGFYNQVFNAARRISEDYLPALKTQGRTLTGLGPGYPGIIDGVQVTPANFATAIAYTYTPHLHGNQVLWQVWNKYFARSYPDGTLVAEDGAKDIWLIEGGVRRKFQNMSVLLSRGATPRDVVRVSRTELLKYEEGVPIKFANYSFLRSPRGTVYLLVGDTLRGFASREALRRVGVNPGEIVNVKQEDLSAYTEAEPITVKSVFPLGTLLSDSKTGGVFWIQDGVKHPIWSREILASNFPGRRATKSTAKELAKYETGSPVLFRDGDLVRSKTDSTIYLISNRERRPFDSTETLTELGFDLKNVATTTEAALAIHAVGQVITSIF